MHNAQHTASPDAQFGLRVLEKPVRLLPLEPYRIWYRPHLKPDKHPQVWLWLLLMDNSDSWTHFWWVITDSYSKTEEKWKKAHSDRGNSSPTQQINVFQRVSEMLIPGYPGENRTTLSSQYEFHCFYVCTSIPPEDVVTTSCVCMRFHFPAPLDRLWFSCAWQNTPATLQNFN